jgi:hypothetical protein
MLRVLIRMGERVVQLGVGEAAGVMGARQREERGVTAGEFI